MDRRALGCLLEIAETLILTLIIFFVIQTFVTQPYQVQQQSMERTLEPTQYVLVDKLTPRFDDYKRGDIIVFSDPPNWPTQPGGTPYIKRVIGVAGDTVDIREGNVYVDDRALGEPYLFDGEPTTAEGLSHWVVPPGDLFVMGDHRAVSGDSRSFGPIPRSDVIGRAWLRYWPLDSFGPIGNPSYPQTSPSAAP